jgi:hypothetical protein
MRKLDIFQSLENMIDELAALHFEIVDQSLDYLQRELCELQQDYTTREDFHAFRAILIFAYDLGLISQYTYNKLQEQANEIWDAYQEAGAPPNVLNEPPTDPEQLALFT